MPSWLQETWGACNERAAGASNPGDGSSKPDFHSKSWTDLTLLMQTIMVAPSSTHIWPGNASFRQTVTTSLLQRLPAVPHLRNLDVTYNSALHDPEPQCLRKSLTFWI